MTYVRHILVGLAGAILALVVWILLRALPAIIEFVRSTQAGASSGDVSVTLDSNELLIAAVVGFAAGWYWRVRRRPR